MGLRTVEEHRAAVRALLDGWDESAEGETLELGTALGEVLLADLTAPVQLPPFANSQMDGYAVNVAALAAAGGRALIAAPIPAGSAAAPLAAGTAAPIMTGAMLPAGADAVVPIEQAVPDTFLTDAQVHDGAREVALPASVPAGQFVRPAGSDIAAGSLVLAAGTVLGPPQLGIIAALGLAEVTVKAQPLVLLLTTGDEVVAPGGELGPGQIFDANSTMLEAALIEAGCFVQRFEVLADSVPAFNAGLEAGLAENPDLILSTGGISQGAYEVVRQALTGHGVEFLSVAMQPGGPQGIGRIDGVPFLGFPGNPVSCYVSFEMFLRPVLSELQGVPPRRRTSAALQAAVHSPAEKHQVRRGRYYSDGTVELVGGPGSHLLHALAQSNALVQLPAGRADFAAGEPVEVWLTAEEIQR